jgi:hypothetical protein
MSSPLFGNNINLFSSQGCVFELHVVTARGEKMVTIYLGVKLVGS